MTPQSPKPSIHDVATGFMVPTAADDAAGFGAGFGVTTNIINGGQECGGGRGWCGVRWVVRAGGSQGRWYSQCLRCWESLVEFAN